MNSLLCAGIWVLSGIGVILAIYAYGYIRAMMPPRNAPKKFMNMGNPDAKKVVVCAGDSITHGRVSSNYVDLLEKHMSGEGFVFVNAGVNSELSWNLLQRYEDIVNCKPDYITVLIGTNDVNGMLSEKVRTRQMKAMKLPQKPDENWFHDNLNSLCAMLKKKTTAKIGLLSIPPLGEDLESAPVNATARISNIVKDVALSNGCVYIPLHETIIEYIKQQGLNPRVHYRNGSEKPMYIAIVKRFLFGKSFDAISRSNGFAVLTDLLHLNDRGALMIANLIEKFILG